MIISLILWWKYPRWFPIPVILACFILFISGNNAISNLLVKSLEWQYTPQADELPTADAIVILGGSVKPYDYPRPMIEVSESGDRVIYGAKLYKMGKSPRIIVTGGRIPWHGNENFPSEAEDMAELLLLLGVPESSIIKEGNSFNTYDNAINTRQILEELKIDRIILVTSALHMPRSVKIFERQNINVIPAPTDYLVTEKSFSEEGSLGNFIINLFPDSNSLNNTTSVMKEYIGMIVYRLKGWI
ncbi:YdcF family protein [Geminocystis sp. CENA526]